jgi:GntR family transcriptional regulator
MMSREPFPRVDRNRAIPLYYQISELLEDLINRGEFGHGEQLMPEEELATRFGVSRPTINKAVGLLLRKSMLYRIRGKGTFIQSGEVRFTLMHELASLHESMRKNNIAFRTEVLELDDQKASARVADHLGLKEGARVSYLKRLRYVEEEPFLISESYMPRSLFPGLEKEDFTDRSLYDVLGRQYDARVVKTERFARAVKAQDKEAHLLHIPIAEPLIQLEGVAFTDRDVRVEYFNTKIRGDRGVLYTTLIRRDENHSS